MASAAARELQNLAEEVTKLSYQNAKLTADLEAASAKLKQGVCSKKINDDSLMAELQKEVISRRQREVDLQKRIDEGKEREAYLEDDLANMWVLISKIKESNSNIACDGPSKSRNGRHQNLHHSVTTSEDEISKEEIKAAYDRERRKRKELESVISRLKVHIKYGVEHDKDHPSNPQIYGQVNPLSRVNSESSISTNCEFYVEEDSSLFFENGKHKDSPSKISFSHSPVTYYYSTIYWSRLR